MLRFVLMKIKNLTENQEEILKNSNIKKKYKNDMK